MISTVAVGTDGSHDADVIVVGNRGMDRRLLGSVPNTVTHKAGRSVFVGQDDLAPKGPKLGRE